MPSELSIPQGIVTSIRESVPLLAQGLSTHHSGTPHQGLPPRKLPTRVTVFSKNRWFMLPLRAASPSVNRPAHPVLSFADETEYEYSGSEEEEEEVPEQEGEPR